MSTEKRRIRELTAGLLIEAEEFSRLAEETSCFWNGESAEAFRQMAADWKAGTAEILEAASGTEDNK